MYAIDFLDRLNRAKQNFVVLESPVSLDLGSYTSTDIGIKSTFSTTTQALVKVRFIPNGKM